MKIISKNEFMNNKQGYLSLIKSGAVFIYPTDTIYGIGCNALITKQVERIREIKKRPNAPFSVIAPSKEWIYENCVVTPESEEYIAKLPGPYTLILEPKTPLFLTDEIGVRLPDHWISEVANEIGYPLVTSSVNQAGKQFMTSLEDIDKTIESQVDLIIEEGEIKGKPSKMIKLTKPKAEVLRD